MSSIQIFCDLRNLLGEARDQGVRETCLAFATSDAHAALIREPLTELSCEYLFYHAKQRDGTSAHQGTTISAIRMALADDGQPVEADWPYLSHLPADIQLWRPPFQTNGLFQRKSELKNFTFDEIRNSIEAAVPVVIVMTLSNAFFIPEQDGLIDSCEPADPTLKHAVLAVGTGNMGNKKFILARNSWGSAWGLSGHAWLSEVYLNPRILRTFILE